MKPYPERLAAREDVQFEQRTWAVTADERARIESREIRGGVVVAVVNDEGAVLLVRNEWMDGYGLPGGGVEPDETWERAAVREVREETGVSIERLRPWRVREQRYEFDGERYDGGYTVFYRARPALEAAVAADPGTDGERIRDVKWFDAVPSEAFQPELLADLLDSGRSDTSPSADA